MKTNNECCEKCHDVYFEKDYPAHTAIEACRNRNCPCHTQRSDWRERFDTYFDNHWGWNLPAEHQSLVGIGILSSSEVKEYVKAFIEAELASQRTALIAEVVAWLEKLEFEAARPSLAEYVHWQNKHWKEEVMPLVKQFAATLVEKEDPSSLRGQ